MFGYTEISVKACRKQIRQLGWKARKAANLHKRIDQLDTEAIAIVSDINAYLANRSLCWDLTRKLISLKGE